LKQNIKNLSINENVVENFIVKSQRFFFDIATVPIQEKRLFEHFTHDGQVFWWALKNMFYRELTRGKGSKTELLLHSWNKLFSHHDPRIKDIGEVGECDCILLNTAFERSEKTENHKSLSWNFKNLETGLEAEKIRFVEVSCINTRAYAKLDTYENFDYKGTFPLNAFIDRKKEDAEVKRAKKVWNEIRQDVKITIAEKCKVHGFEEERVLSALDTCMTRAYPEIVRDYYALIHAIKIFGAKAVFVLGHEDRHNIAAILATKKAGIKSIEIRHGVIPEIFKYPETFPFPDRMCLDGRRDYERLKGSIPKERLAVTGNPRYDKTADLPAEERIREKYSLGDKKIVLWPTQTHDPVMVENGEDRINAKKVIECFKKIEDMQLAIKLHPDENQDAPIYRELAKENEVDILIFDRNAKTNELIKASEAVIIKSSTVGLESLIIGVPLILLQYVKSLDISEYSAFGFEVASDKNELESIIKEKKYLRDFDNKRREFIKERVENLGKASKKVAEELADLVGLNALKS
jgi:predicted glycosyltransferase